MCNDLDWNQRRFHYVNMTLLVKEVLFTILVQVHISGVKSSHSKPNRYKILKKTWKYNTSQDFCFYITLYFSRFIIFC